MRWNAKESNLSPQKAAGLQPAVAPGHYARSLCVVSLAARNEKSRLRSSGAAFDGFSANQVSPLHGLLLRIRGGEQIARHGASQLARRSPRSTIQALCGSRMSCDWFHDVCSCDLLYGPTMRKIQYQKKNRVRGCLRGPKTRLDLEMDRSLLPPLWIGSALMRQHDVTQTGDLDRHCQDTNLTLYGARLCRARDSTIIKRVYHNNTR